VLFPKENMRLTLLQEILGHLNFTILPKCGILTRFKFAFLSERHLEIPVKATVRMEPSAKSIEPIERFKQLEEQHYKEPVNGQFEDCTREVPPGVETESSSDEEDQNITTG